MQSMQKKTAEERKAAMKANRTQRETQHKALEEWATQNGIDVTYLLGGFGKYGEKGMRGK